MRLCVGTAKGIVILDPNRGSTPLMALADPPSVWCVAQDFGDANLLYAGSVHNSLAGSARGKGSLARSTDGGRTWHDITPRMARDEEVWSLATAPDKPGELLAGTSHARIFRSEDGGRAFHECASFLRLPGRERWSFPSASHASHVRSLAFDPNPPHTLYAGVEEGGVFCSRDRGRSFEPLNQTVYSDVHCVAVDTEDSNRIYVTTGRGLYISGNGGTSWRHIKGLSRSYAIPILVRPGASAAVYVAAAAGPPPTWPMGSIGADAMMFRSADRGASFRPIASGDGSTHATRGMVMRLLADRANDGILYGVLSDGSIIRIDEREEMVAVIAEKLPPAYDLALLP
jgi:hypothetical protein